MNIIRIKSRFNERDFLFLTTMNGAQDHLDFFKELLTDRCYIDSESLEKYSHDETEDISILPGVVLKPNSTEEISKILRYCNQNLIPVTPSGARTGLSGGAIPTLGGVALSMENFNKILSIDENNHQVTTEPGVITQVLQETVKEKGLFYPPDPASKGSCFIGGNVSENSGGPKAVKYGVTNEYVLNLEVVLPNGEIIWTGANVLKNATGYNLTQLLVGSEGTLGIITKIVLKLIPHPTHDLLMLVPFYNAEEACKAVAAFFKKGITPSGLEFMERDALIWTRDFLGDSSIKVNENHAAHLLIEVDGFDPEQLMDECAQIVAVLEDFETDEILFAESQAQKDKLWKLRRSVGEAVKGNSIYKEEDTVVPRYELPTLLHHVKRIGNAYGFKSVCYGHAGDGNLHINIIKGNLTDQQWNEELPIAIRELFEEVVNLGGTLSGEHGIGLVQKQYMDIPFSETSLQLMRSIKSVFDPNGILNPGKIF
jgi:glycolate oxidase